MKKHLILLLIPFLFGFQTTECDTDKCPGQCYELAAMNPYVAGTVKAASCTASVPGSDNSELGYLSVGGSNTASAIGGKIYCMLFTADCSGTLGTAYFYNRSTGTKNKVAAYSTTDTVHSTPPTNGTRLGYTSEITAGADDDWYSAAMSGGTVTQGNKYWLCYLTPAKDGGVGGNNDAGVDRHGIDYAVGEYTTPPSTLPSSGWGTTTDRKMSVFIGIQ